MHVLLVNYAYAPAPSPEALLDRFRTLTGWAEGLQGAGARVSVLQRFTVDGTVVRHGIAYRTVGDRLRPHPALWQLPGRLHRVARSLAPDLIHVNGLLFPLQLRALARAVPGAALVAQHHAESPFGGWLGWLQRWGLRAADGFLFVTEEQARAWRAILPAGAPRFEVMEGSTYLAPPPRAAARQETGSRGEPALLWVGRLNQNKDPLTVLEGVARLAETFPTLHLSMIFSEATLLPEVTARVAGDPRLVGRVSLIGEVPHRRLAAWYSAADLFVLGSHQEGSGYALLEAMACGALPLVTDIPSFRAITGGGQVGALWKVGEAGDLERAARALLARPLDEGREAARRLFQERWSFAAIGRRALEIYRTVLAGR